jgi:hypothetical protein
VSGSASRIGSELFFMNPEEAKLKVAMWEREDAAFADAVDAVMADKWNTGKALVLGETPAIFIKCGAQNYNLAMTADIVAKVVGKSRDGHTLTPEQLKQLPRELRQSLAVLKSATFPNSLVALTDLKEGRAHVIAAIHLEKREGRIFVNRIASVYGKQRMDFYKPELLLYVEKNGGLPWFQSAGLQLPMEGTTSTLCKKILTEDDIVNHPSKIREMLQKHDPKTIVDKVFKRAIQFCPACSSPNSLTKP